MENNPFFFLYDIADIRGTRQVSNELKRDTKGLVLGVTVLVESLQKVNIGLVIGASLQVMQMDSESL